MDHGFNAWGRGAAWLRLATASACVAASLAAAPAPAPEDAPPAWEYVSRDAFQQAWMTFETAGIDVHAAHELAHLAVFGTPPVDLEATGVVNCIYWRLKTYWCHEGIAQFTTTNVSFRCVSEATQACPSFPCDPGKRAVFQLTTGSTCAGDVPAHTCVFVEVEGPFASNRPEVCGNTVNCACWPTLACSTRVCVPWTAANLPGKCPDCEAP